MALDYFVETYVAWYVAIDMQILGKYTSQNSRHVQRKFLFYQNVSISIQRSSSSVVHEQTNARMTIYYTYGKQEVGTGINEGIMSWWQEFLLSVHGMFLGSDVPSFQSTHGWRRGWLLTTDAFAQSISGFLYI